MFYPWTVVVGFFIGAALGSFVNVLIWRMPRGESIINPPSHCPSCGARLGLLDLFPLLSFLLLRAKCRHCGTPVSWRYFWVEVLCGALWAGLWWQYLVVGATPGMFLAYAMFVTALVAIVFIDIAHFIIPDELNAWLLFVGIIYGSYRIVSGDPGAWTEVGGVHLPTFAVGAVLGGAILWGIAFLGRVMFRKDAMGHGDIKMARGMGSLLAPGMLIVALALSVAFGALIGIALILASSRGQKAHEEQEEETEPAPATPEPIWALTLLGIYYLLALDVVALVIPPFGKLVDGWFTRMVTRHSPDWLPPTEDVEDEFEAGPTHIPFGPYLALGTTCVLMFQSVIQGWVDQYLRLIAGPGS